MDWPAAATDVRRYPTVSLTCAPERGFLAIAVAVCVAPGSWLGAQTSLLTRADTQAAIAASRASAGCWWLDVVLPPLTAQQVACRTGWSADRIHERPYLWRIMARPRDVNQWGDPFHPVLASAQGVEAAGAILRTPNDGVTIAWCDGWAMVPYLGGTVTLR